MKETILASIVYVFLFPFMVLDYFNARSKQGNAYWNKVVAKSNDRKKAEKFQEVLIRNVRGGK